MIITENLSKSFGKIAAVQNVSFTAANGAITGLLGPNGAGKSTILRMLATLIIPSKGTARVDQHDIIQNALAVRQNIGVLPHNAGIYPRLTARENIRYYGQLCNVPEEYLNTRIDELIDVLEMQSFADRHARINRRHSSSNRQKRSRRRFYHRDQQQRGHDMKKVGLIFRKELLDNLRDRRSLTMAIIFGPLFGPLLFMLIMQAVIQSRIAEEEKPTELAVIGAEYAPNLLQFLQQNNINVQNSPDDPVHAIRERQYKVILEISAEFGAQLHAGKPAVVRLYSDRSNGKDHKSADRISTVLNSYNQRLVALRLQLRGINPLTLSPIVIEDRDVSTSTSRSALLLSMLPFYLILSIVMGGFYLAIDTTAGERERKSLEPLLTLPVTRIQLVLGKLGATTFFCLISFVLALIIFSLVLPYIPLEKVNMSLNFGPGVILQLFCIGLPLVFFLSTILMLVATFAKSYKEAQTYLSLIFILPTALILIAEMTSVSATLKTMLIPIMSQHFLFLDAIKGETSAPLLIAVSFLSTFLYGFIPLGASYWLYRQERLLG